MNFIRITAFIAVTMIAFACTTRDSKRSSEVMTPNKDIGFVDEKDEEESVSNNGFNTDSTIRQQQSPPGDKQKQQQQQKEPANKPYWDKKIIKTATLNLEVKDYNTFYTSLREKVRAAGGYIAQEEQSQSDYKIENSLIIKVPVDQFDNAVVQFTANTEKINEKKISSQDVTTEVIDTKSRMEAKKQVRLRYMDLLKQAKNMEEILSVQSEINGIQEEIESAAGRIEYLGHSSSFSTINLTYYQILNSSAKDTNNPSFGTKLSSAFRTGWSWMGDLFVGLVSVWPLFLIIFIGVIIYKRTKLQKPKQA
ncbi:MAG TPA: DUF4349 domain-containing protein [Chitinophagaceae bacterium]|nr:DUF4349 domain-containing protein [Chitinophagaceae bacterium]